MTRRLNRIQQAYGYIVCLIAIISGLIAGTQLLNSTFDLSRPRGFDQYGQYAPLSSFEAFRTDRQSRAATPAAPAPVLPADSVLHREYDEQVRSAQQYAHWNATKSIVTHGIVLVVAIVLFATHWRWLRNAGEDSSEPHRLTT